MTGAATCCGGLSAGRRAMGKCWASQSRFCTRCWGWSLDVMGNAYPELTTSRAFAADVTLHEEERFGETLETGLRVLAKVADDTRQGGKTVIPGEEVFKLYDTYGFPLDLAEEIVQDQGLTLDMAGFDQAMDRQREMARAAWKGSGDTSVKSVYPTLVERLGQHAFPGLRYPRSAGESPRHPQGGSGGRAGGGR